MRFETPKGISDIWFEEFDQRKWLYSKIDKVLRSYGFLFLEPSPLEYLETLVAKSGPEIEKEIYSFDDKKGEKLALRFDLTVGMARMIASKQLPLPVRAANIGSVWRYDNPQHGRYRWFWQWDAEIFGSPKTASDAEIIAVTCDIMDAVGLKDYTVMMNSRKLMEGFLLSIGTPKERLLAVMRVVDKKAKMSDTDFEKELLKAGLTNEQVSGIRVHLKGVATVVDESNDRFVTESADEIAEIMRLLKSYGCKERCDFDSSIVRGFDYYTGIVFEVRCGDAGSIAGGGRFDELVGIYGKPTPSVGAAGGIERMLISLQSQGAIKNTLESSVAVIAVNGELLGEAVKTAQHLRAEGIRAITDIQGRDLRGQLEYANRAGIKRAIIIGPRELGEGKVTLRDMESGKETKEPMKGIHAKLL